MKKVTLLTAANPLEYHLDERPCHITNGGQEVLYINHHIVIYPGETLHWKGKCYEVLKKGQNEEQ